MILQFFDRKSPKINTRIPENIDALEKANKNEKMIIEIRVIKRSLFCLYFECIHSQRAKEKNNNKDAENSKGSAKNEAYLGLAP